MPPSSEEGYAEETSPSNRISNELNIRTGDNVHSVKSALKDIEFEMSERGGSHQVSIIRIPDNGVSVKLLRGRVYLVEVKSPFAGFVNGLSIGDTKESVGHKMKRYLPFEQDTSVKWSIKLVLHEKMVIIFGNDEKVKSITIYNPENMAKAFQILKKK